MGIPDEESWWRRSYLPTGAAHGWRRTFFIALVLVLFALVLVAAVIGR